VHDRQALVLRQGFEQQRQVAPGFVCAVVRALVWALVAAGKQRQILVQRLVERFVAGAAAPQIDQLVARQRVHPSGQRFTAPVGVALGVYGHQGFLNQIFNFIW